MKTIFTKFLRPISSYKLRFLILTMSIFTSINSYGQGRCTNATTINDPDYNVLKTFSFPTDTNFYWMKFVADTFDYRITISRAFTEPHAYVTNITLYGGTCGNLQIIESDANEIFVYNLTQGSTYYLRVEKAFYTYGEFNIFINKQVHSNNTRSWVITDCPPPQCDLIHNGAFNPVNTSGPFKDAFYEQNVCGWYNAWASPDIFYDQISNYTAFLGSYVNGASYTDEGIWQVVNLNANTNYNLYFDYRTLNATPLTELRIYLADNNIDALFNHNYTPIPVTSIDNLVSLHAIKVNNAQLSNMVNTGPLHPVSPITVNTPNASFNRLVFFVVNNTGSNNGIYLDNVRLTVSNLYLTADVSSPCEAGNLGSIDLTVHNGTGAITYAWSNGATSEDISNLSPGNYSVTVTDDNNCPVTEIYTVLQGQTPACPVLADQYGNYIVSNCGQTISQFSYQISNPETNVQYTWTLSPGNAGYFNNTTGLTSVTANYVIINWTNVPAFPYSATINIHCENTLTGCENDCTYEFNSACTLNADISLCNTDAVTSLPSNYYNGITFLINGYFDINKSMTFYNCTFIMGPLSFMRILSTSSAQHTATFSKCVISANECYHMWDGIYIINQYSKLVFEGTTMEDAINGVVSKYYGQYDLYSSTLSDNYKCLQAFGIPQSTNTLNGSIKSCTLSGTLSLPYQPYAGQPSYSGVEATDIGVWGSATGIKIGNETLSTDINYFTNLLNGVIGKRSNLILYNNNFTNNNAVSLSNGAVVAAGSGNSNEINTLIVGGTQSTLFRKNYINNYLYGITGAYNMNMDIAKNEFSGCDIGIDYWLCNSANTVNITSNTMLQGNTAGIYAPANNSCTSNISCNTITMVDNNYNAGIYVSNYAGSSNPNEIYNLNANTITAYNGIEAMNVNRINANKNSITLYNNNYGVTSYGMLFQSCDIQNIYNCKIYGVATPTRTNKFGISIESTGHPLYKCNTINYCNRAFNIAGTNVNPVTVSILNNTFNNCDYGMVKSNSGRIGQQGNTTTPWLNKFNSVTTHTYGIPPLQNDNCWTRTYNPYQNENFNGSVNAFSKQPVTCNPCTVPACPISVMCLSLPGLSGSWQNEESAADDNPNDLPAADSAANPDLKNIIANTFGIDETGWYLAKQKVYSHLINRQSDYANDAVFGNFIHACNGNSIGKLYKAGYYIGSGKADSAEMINNSIVTTNIADSLHVFVNRYCIKYLRNGSVAEPEADNLRQITALCPFEYGEGVYIARGLLNMIDKMPAAYSNACETAVIINKSMNAASENDENNIQLALYPNPAKDQITISYTNPENNADDMLLEIYDLPGKKQLENLIISGSDATISTAGLEQGIYLYRFVYKSSIIRSGKLVIIK